MYQQRQIRLVGPLTDMVKILLIFNAAIFIFQQFANLIDPYLLGRYFALSHAGLIVYHYFWQVFTYMFLHGGWLHIFFNMFALWMFGAEIERHYGSRFFLLYYLLSGVGAGVCIAIMNWVLTMGDPSNAFVPTMGASGAVYALLLAYGMTWPNREVYLYFLFPVKMKYLVIGYGLIEFFGTLNTLHGVGGNISNVGHLGGLLTGLILFGAGFARNTSQINIPSFSKKNPLESFLKKQRIEKKRQQIEKRIKAKEIIDRLLDKIAAHGVQSLTPEEKNDLEWARRNYYPDNNETLH